jgi:hypothetical protein
MSASRLAYLIQRDKLPVGSPWSTQTPLGVGYYCEL